ncbi:uncharacterized protein RHIMIDRAFT_257036 [Rhizopus microsporus ATCC 52813]|uniref:Uncharacterized protein n=1 Tax=Rhizopus microsporus ATCC 52813 TaxID=1340429 RepID=A0A2G4SS22_RHIZD|nr:uncharacterized protein RHIMIDRAFT_257036 [Rhizopus microsporus ATCC 52813]PHZ11186.1 hypothetical protein RHIMIDRAFT_257036 [Rhizopus microsporus ATCC 52813]
MTAYIQNSVKDSYRSSSSPATVPQIFLDTLYVYASGKYERSKLDMVSYFYVYIKEDITL